MILISTIILQFDKSVAKQVYPLNGHSFMLSQLADNGDVQTLEFLVDEQGHFYREIVQGAGMGDFEAWDGNKFYRYNKQYNNIMLVDTPEDDGKVISHPILSEIMNQEVNDDIQNGKLKKSFLKPVYKKSYHADDQEIMEQITLDKDLNYTEEYLKKIDGVLVQFYEVSKVKELKGALNVEALINIDELKANNVHIKEIAR